MPNALKLVADVLLITDRDLTCGALIGEQDDGKARMLSAGLTRALAGLFLDSGRETTPTLEEVARFGFPADKPSLRHDLANFLCFCDEESSFEIGDAQPLSAVLGPESVVDDRIKLGERETLRPAGVQRQRVVGNAIFTVVITDVEMSGELTPDAGLKAAPRKPAEQPELNLTITDGCGVCGVCGACGLCVVCAEINYGTAGAASAALWSIGGSASMEYCDQGLANAIRQEQTDLLTFHM